MAEAGKHCSISGGAFISDLFSVIRTRRTVTFAYGLMCAFVLFTVFVAFNPSPNPSSPWFTNIFTARNADSAAASTDSYKSQFSSFFSYLFSNSSSEPDKVSSFTSSLPLQTNTTGSENASLQSPAAGVENSTNPVPSTKSPKSEARSVNTEQIIPKNQTEAAVLDANRTVSGPVVNKPPPISANQTQSRDDFDKVQILNSNQTSIEAPKAAPAPAKVPKTAGEKGDGNNSTYAASPSQK